MVQRGSLWRRAPAWRGLVITAGFLTGLAVLYPPHLPSLAPQTANLPPSSYRAPTAAPNAATPAPVSAPVSAGSSALPQSNAGLAYGDRASGAVSFAGHAVPLPPGEWQVVARISLTGPGGETVEGNALAKIVRNELVGLVLLSGNDLSSPSKSGYPPEGACERSDLLYTRVAANEDRGRQDCLFIGHSAVAAWATDATQPVLRASIGDLSVHGVRLPHIMVTTTFREADTQQFLSATFFFSPEAEGIAAPPPSDATGSEWSKYRIAGYPKERAFVDRLRSWANDWWPLMRDGFAGRLKPGPLPAAVADRAP